jgi:hypothetical protein
MPSQVWGRNPREAYEEPYEYAVQDQFIREATLLYDRLYSLLNSEEYRFTVHDQSRMKALWLLAMDALDSLRDCLKALIRKEHRTAGKLFRDIVESMDLAALFDSGTAKSHLLLKKWYRNEIIPNREYRNLVERTESKERAKRLALHYSSLSRFTHRSYLTILDGYSKGRDERLVHDATGGLYGKSKEAPTMLVLPHTISAYYALLANLTLIYADEIQKRSILKKEEITEAFARSLETETIPRRFLPRRWLADKLAKPLMRSVRV